MNKKKKEEHTKKQRKDSTKEQVNIIKELTALKEQYEEKKKEAEEYKNLAQRLKAEFDNYKKRVLRENEYIINRANENLVKEIINVLDTFEKGLETEISENKKFKAFYNGMEMVYKQLKDILIKKGLRDINPVKEDFDPEYHEAILMEEKKGIDKLIVSEVFQKGYSFGDKLLRPAKVKVLKPVEDRMEEEKRENEDLVQESKINGN